MVLNLSLIKKSLFLGLILVIAPFLNLNASEGLGLGGQASSQDWDAVEFTQDELQLAQAIVSQESHTPIESEHETKEQIERQLIEADAQRKYEAQTLLRRGYEGQAGEIDIKEKMSILMSLNNEDFTAAMKTIPQEDLYAIADAINFEATPRTDTEVALTPEQIAQAGKALFNLKPADIDRAYRLLMNALESTPLPKELMNLILQYYLPEHRWAVAPTLVKKITKLSEHGDSAFSDDSNQLVHVYQDSLDRYQKNKKKNWELATDPMKLQDEIDLRSQLENNKDNLGGFKNNVYKVDHTGSSILFKKNDKTISKKSTTQQCRHNEENYQITINSLHLADTFCVAFVTAQNMNGGRTNGIAIFDLASALTANNLQMNLLNIQLINCKNFATNADTFAVCDWANNIHIYRADTNEWEQFPLNIPIGGSNCNMHLSRNGSYLLIHIPGQKKCSIIYLASQKVVYEIPSQAFINTWFFSPDNTHCALESYQFLRLFKAQEPCGSLEEFLVRIALQNATTKTELTQLQSTKPFKKLPQTIQADMIVTINEKNDALKKQAQAINVGAVIPVAAAVGGAPVIIPAPGLGESRISLAFRYLTQSRLGQSVIRAGQILGIDRLDVQLVSPIIATILFKKMLKNPHVDVGPNNVANLLIGFSSILLLSKPVSTGGTRLGYMLEKIGEYTRNNPKTFGLIATLTALGVAKKNPKLLEAIKEPPMKTLTVWKLLQAKLGS